ncbi:MAG TPA: hypothetical protein VJV05_08665, partial [Pyrinomonadaceae bacterium]|nr:hypothetical protein [Pyrinomonadaceae bacterium]
MTDLKVMISRRNTTSRIKLLVVVLFLCLVSTAFWKGETLAEQSNAMPTPTPSATPMARAIP